MKNVMKRNTKAIVKELNHDLNQNQPSQRKLKDFSNYVDKKVHNKLKLANLKVSGKESL